MKYNRQIVKDKKRRRQVAKDVNKRLFLKSLAYNQLLAFDQSDEARARLAKLPRNGSTTRIKNRCVITGRSAAVSRDFKISRIKLRELASFGQLPGVRKAA